MTIVNLCMILSSEKRSIASSWKKKRKWRNIFLLVIGLLLFAWFYSTFWARLAFYRPVYPCHISGTAEDASTKPTTTAGGTKILCMPISRCCCLHMILVYQWYLDCLLWIYASPFCCFFQQTADILFILGLLVSQWILYISMFLEIF